MSRPEDERTEDQGAIKPEPLWKLPSAAMHDALVNQFVDARERDAFAKAEVDQPDSTYRLVDSAYIVDNPFPQAYLDEVFMENPEIAIGYIFGVTGTGKTSLAEHLVTKIETKHNRPVRLLTVEEAKAIAEQEFGKMVFWGDNEEAWDFYSNTMQQKIATEQQRIEAEGSNELIIVEGGYSRRIHGQNPCASVAEHYAMRNRWPDTSKTLFINVLANGLTMDKAIRVRSNAPTWLLSEVEEQLAAENMVFLHAEEYAKHLGVVKNTDAAMSDEAIGAALLHFVRAGSPERIREQWDYIVRQYQYLHRNRMISEYPEIPPAVYQGMYSDDPDEDKRLRAFREVSRAAVVVEQNSMKGLLRTQNDENVQFSKYGLLVMSPFQDGPIVIDLANHIPHDVDHAA